MTLIGAIFVQHYGGKMPYLLCVCGISCLTLLTPLIAINGWIYMCIKQIMEGVLMTLCFPSVLNMLGKWIHPVEKDTIAPIVLSGPGPGAILAIFSSGFIASSKLGWPGTFYIPGIIGIIWSIIWYIYGKKSPANCKSLSMDERLFLESIPGTRSSSTRSKTPWKQILLSKPVWAQILSLTGYNWGFQLLVALMPTYITKVLGFNIESVIV